MIVRKINPEEIKTTDELFAIAFEFPYENDKTASEVYEEVISHPDTRGSFYWQERWAAFEDDNKTMMSYFVAKPYPVNFDGKTFMMTGIGGVATLPQYRRSGGIRKCFEAALPNMYENGIAFSYLYPFSTAYYRKFGYELCCEKMQYRLRLDMLPSYTVDGHCYLVTKESPSALEDIKAVWQTWQNKYNMSIVNEDFEYAWIKRCNPARDQSFTYIYKSSTGNSKGYITFSKVDEPSGRNLTCKHFVYTDLEGFKGLMNLVRSLCSDHHYLTFELPTDQYISPLLPEWASGAGSKSISLCGMARVVNVKKVLENALYRGTGTLKIGVTDRYIAENNHTFQVDFKDNQAEQVSVTSASPDISMNINDFSRLIIGVCETEAISFLEDVSVSTDWASIGKVFYKKPIFISEYF